MRCDGAVTTVVGMCVTGGGWRLAVLPMARYLYFLCFLGIFFSHSISSSRSRHTSSLTIKGEPQRPHAPGSSSSVIPPCMAGVPIMLRISESTVILGCAFKISSVQRGRTVVRGMMISGDSSVCGSGAAHSTFRRVARVHPALHSLAKNSG